VRRRLQDPEILDTVGRAGTKLVTAFSSLGTGYFVVDPLG